MPDEPRLCFWVERFDAGMGALAPRFRIHQIEPTHHDEFEGWTRTRRTASELYVDRLFFTVLGLPEPTGDELLEVRCKTKTWVPR